MKILSVLQLIGTISLAAFIYFTFRGGLKQRNIAGICVGIYLIVMGAIYWIDTGRIVNAVLVGMGIVLIYMNAYEIHVRPAREKLERLYDDVEPP